MFIYSFNYHVKYNSFQKINEESDQFNILSVFWSIISTPIPSQRHQLTRITGLLINNDCDYYERSNARININ